MYGTLTTLDDLRDNTQTIADFGETDLVERLRPALQYHNQVMQETIADFAIITSDRQRGYGGGAEMEMQELDQMGNPDVQKVDAAGNLGLPLRFYGIAVQWNRHFVVNTSVARAIEQIDAAATADVRNVTRQIRRALMTPINNLTYSDKLMMPVLILQLRALLNGDGMGIPAGPNGETFAANHTHYLGAATFTEAHLNALLETVLEHGVTGGMAIYINRAQEAALRAFAGFTPYVDARINVPLTEQTARGEFDVNNPTDRAIGIFNGAVVSVKPWVPASYQIAFDRGAGNDKALAIRTRSGGMGGDAYAGGFGLLYEDDDFPLRARALGREFGAGVVNRHKAAVGFSGNATYTAPAGL